LAAILGADILQLKKEGDKIFLAQELAFSDRILLCKDFCTRGTGFREAVLDIWARHSYVNFILYEPVVINRGGLSFIEAEKVGNFTILPIADHRINDWKPSECPSANWDQSPSSRKQHLKNGNTSSLPSYNLKPSSSPSGPRPGGLFSWETCQKWIFPLKCWGVILHKIQEETAMITVVLGELKVGGGNASAHLLECLSKQRFPLAGIAEIPYVPGSEILENFSARLWDPYYCYLVKKDDVLQVLSRISPAAAAEVREKYGNLDYLPLKGRSCKPEV